MKTIVGIESRKGSFVGDDGNTREYSTVTVHYLDSDVKENVVGSLVGSYKTSESKLKEVLGNRDYKSVIGKSISFDVSFKADGTPYISSIEIK